VVRGADLQASLEAKIHDHASEKRKNGRHHGHTGFTPDANTSPSQRPGWIFYLMDARNPAVMAFHMFNLHKILSSRRNERISIITFL